MTDPGPPTRPPLEDVRILAIEQYGTGPWATQQLSDLGAEVVKIEDPRTFGDVGRYVPPFQSGEDSLFFETFNGGKRSIQLDLKNPAGRGVFLRLVERSDAVFSNLRGDQPAKLGLRYVDLAQHNPRIVCCSLSGYGQDGPRAASGALDYVVQGLAGWMTLSGEPGSPPTRVGLSLIDYAGGYLAAIALLGGLWRARRDGVGCDCDISLQETALALLTYIGTWAATEGYVPPRRHPTPVTRPWCPSRTSRRPTTGSSSPARSRSCGSASAARSDARTSCEIPPTAT
jgi:crotonobetainyl-CoA:carnitine CoA-transferase CaiB-like acyl-CoA transferase